MPGPFYSQTGPTYRDRMSVNQSLKVKDSIFSGEEILLVEDNVTTIRASFFGNPQQFRAAYKRSRINWYLAQPSYMNVKSPIWFRAISVMRGNNIIPYGDFTTYSKRHVILEKPFALFDWTSIGTAFANWKGIFDNGNGNFSEASLYIQLYIPCNGLIEPPHIKALVNTAYQDLVPTWESEPSYQTHFTRWFKIGNLTGWNGLVGGWETRIQDLNTNGESLGYTILDCVDTAKPFGLDNSYYSAQNCWNDLWTVMNAAYSGDKQNKGWQDLFFYNIYLEEKGRIFKKPISPIRGFKYETGQVPLNGNSGYIPGSNSFMIFASFRPAIGTSELCNFENTWSYVYDDTGKPVINTGKNIPYVFQKLTYRMTESDEVLCLKQRSTDYNGSEPRYAWEWFSSEQNNTQYYNPKDPFNTEFDPGIGLGYDRFKYGGGLQLTPYSAASYAVSFSPVEPTEWGPGSFNWLNVIADLNTRAEEKSGHEPQYLLPNPGTVDPRVGFILSAEYYDIQDLVDIFNGYGLSEQYCITVGYQFRFALFPDKATSLIYNRPQEASTISGGLGGIMTFKEERFSVPFWITPYTPADPKAPLGTSINPGFVNRGMNSDEIRLYSLFLNTGPSPILIKHKNHIMSKMRPGNVEIRFCTWKSYDYTSAQNANGWSTIDYYDAQPKAEFGRFANKKLILKKYGKNLTFHLVYEGSSPDHLLPQYIEVNYPL
jgi:hypothetical protein